MTRPAPAAYLRGRNVRPGQNLEHHSTAAPGTSAPTNPFSAPHCPRVEAGPREVTHDIAKIGVPCRRMLRSRREVPAKSTSECERHRHSDVSTPGSKSFHGQSSETASYTKQASAHIHRGCCATSRVQQDLDATRWRVENERPHTSTRQTHFGHPSFTACL